jgi:hypothetical protein
LSHGHHKSPKRLAPLQEATAVRYNHGSPAGRHDRCPTVNDGGRVTDYSHSGPRDTIEPKARKSVTAIPSVVVRIVASLLLGAGTYVLTNSVGQSNTESILLSVFVGGVVLVAQYLAQSERQISESLAQSQRQISESLVQSQRQISESLALFERHVDGLSRSTRFHEAVEASPLDVASLEKLVANLATIKNLGSDLVSQLVMGEVARLMNFVAEVTDGSTFYPGEDREWLLALTKAAQGEISATSSTTVDGSFWGSELGEQYLNAQRDAVLRGVQVRRIFLVENEDYLSDHAFSQVRARHEQLKIDHRVLLGSDLSDLTRGKYRNFALFDKRIYYQVSNPPLLHPRGAVVETWLSLKHKQVSEQTQFFEELWKLAET